MTTRNESPVVAALPGREHMHASDCAHVASGQLLPFWSELGAPGDGLAARPRRWLGKGREPQTAKSGLIVKYVTFVTSGGERGNRPPGLL